MSNPEGEQATTMASLNPEAVEFIPTFDQAPFEWQNGWAMQPQAYPQKVGGKKKKKSQRKNRAQQPSKHLHHSYETRVILTSYVENRLRDWRHRIDAWRGR
jgi:hypothetical protein